MKRSRLAFGTAVLLSAVISAWSFHAAKAVAQTRPAAATQVPRLEVDPLWPEPFPVEKHWALGSVTGVTVDSRDNIWVTHRGVDSLQTNEKGPTLATWAAECCYAAPQVLQFDASGRLLDRWGGPGQGYQWPQNPSGIAVDSKGHVWIAAAGAPAAAGARGARGAVAPSAALTAAVAAAAAGRGAAGAPAAPTAAAQADAPAAQGARGARGATAAATPAAGDAHIIKFTSGGNFLLQIGTPGQSDTPDSTTTLNRPSAIAIDEAANEVYVADTGNRRIVVFDATTGAHKRHWFGSGDKTAGEAPPAYDPAAPAARSFRDVSCVKISRDGLVYVCDRSSNRIQVFQKNGAFVKEALVAKDTRAEGSVWDVAFSNDAQERFLYVADGLNKTVWMLQRDTLTPVSRFGDGGRYPGLFYAVARVAVDSRGNVYTGEGSEGKRVQKWINRGMGAPRPLN